MQFVHIAAAGCVVIVLTMGSQRKQPRSSVVTAKPSSDNLPAPAPPERQERIPLAIFFMVSAGAIFSFSSAASKLLAETYPVGEVLFSRVLVSLVLFSAFALPTAGIAVFRTRRPAAHVLRSMSQFTSQTLLLIAFTLMPLASATAINFSAPLFAAPRLADLSQGADRPGALGRAADRLCRRADRHQSGRRDVPDRRAVRARQRRPVRHGDRGRARHDLDEIGRRR